MSDAVQTTASAAPGEAATKGANTVLGLTLLIIPLERNKGREFGDIVAAGTMANCSRTDSASPRTIVRAIAVSAHEMSQTVCFVRLRY